ncbi:type III-B CRISPR-associated protein Cas10/Cmr2 [Paenibacillus doosanensis]|uniref:type III-B CRISPR-associated protein Cas10/Cmr2 n=1 Tax=Paenibacillus doosanensis TaxID=1229154 RepID=UPI0021809282|nr:type III-B CRISPR-associated protein Cas10/Cmr2 [Paenibacillus doosanensis]MCS7459009.1 type III-B CRISPR-associated protein Cas10/Cmr2 [Paenibacillus doosanensis]
MNTTLFLFTIGPVKSFIEHSRKARDLYAGSYLLSYLMRAAVEELHRHKPKLEIIFPLANQSNVPNRLIAKVNGYSQREKEQLGQELSQFVQKRFIELCEQIFDKSKVIPNQIATRQIERFLELYWVFEPEPDYSLAYNKINANLNNIKRLRSFEQTFESSGRKCNIYPEYNAIFVKQKDGKLPSFVDEQNVIDVTQLETCRYSMKPGEGLSAIAFIKRMLHLLEADQLLPEYSLNISSVAYMLLKNSWRKEKYKELELLKDEASEALFDLQNGQKLSIDEYSSDNIEIAKKMYQELNSDAFRVSPYYALLKFDGDGMGQLYRDYPTRQTQEQLSQNTSHFSNRVRAIISEQGGICIYAGGEDFLGFLPVSKLFITLYQLRQEFIAQVKSPVEHGKSLTFSAGIVIAHLMQPLGAMLARTSEMERQAKELYEEKNAFAIGLVKRSGDQLLVKSSFGKNGEILLLIDKIATALSQKEYSKSFIYNLSKTLEKLGGINSSDQQSLVRVLIEQALQKSTSFISNQEFASQSNMLYELFLHFDSDMARFKSFLQFLEFVSRGACSDALRH